MGYTRRSILVLGTASIAFAGCLDGETDGTNGGGTDPDEDDSTPADEESEPNDADDGATDGAGDGDEDVSDDTEDAADVTVSVGVDGELRFDPETLEIDPGTTVEFVWEASHHNIAVTDQPDGADWEGVSATQDAGYTHTHTFEVEGRYEYLCEPHEGADMRGTVLAGDVDDDVGGTTDDGDDGTGSGPGYGY